MQKTTIVINPGMLRCVWDEPLNYQQPVLIPPTVNFNNRFGKLSSRRGFSIEGSVVAGLSGKKVVGGISFVDYAARDVYVISTLTEMFVIDNNTHTDWFSLGVYGTPRPDGISYPINYFVGPTSKQTIWINDPTNGCIYWQLGDAVFTAAVAAPKALVGCTVLGRALHGNTIEGGIYYPWRVRWSKQNDITAYPALAFADLIDNDDNIVAMKTLNRTQAVIYKRHSQWVATARAGSDAAAFSFELIDHQIGPIDAVSVVAAADGTHVYLGHDGNLYRFDGSRSSMIDTLETNQLVSINMTEKKWTSGAFELPLQNLWWTFQSDQGSV